MPTQFGLFQGPENVKTKDAEIQADHETREALAELARPKAPRPMTEIRLSILRGFLSLHFTEDPERLIRRPLKLLGGKTLLELIPNDWPLVYAWTQEYRLHPEEKDLLISPHRGKND